MEEIMNNEVMEQEVEETNEELRPIGVVDVAFIGALAIGAYEGGKWLVKKAVKKVKDIKAKKEGEKTEAIEAGEGDIVDVTPED